MGIPLDAPLTHHKVVYTLPMLTIKEDKGKSCTTAAPVNPVAPPLGYHGDKLSKQDCSFIVNLFRHLSYVMVRHFKAASKYFVVSVSQVPVL